jgi:hypothetical protein
VAGHAAREDGGGDATDRHPEVERVLHGPDAGALLARLVEHDVDERLAGVGVDLLEHLGGDLDEVRLEVAGVPRREGLGDLRRLLPTHGAQQIVGLGDELHVGVLDTVVDHLDEVAGTVGADVRHARLALGLGRDRRQDRPERLVRLGRAARHDARAVECALLATGDAGADEVEALGADRLLAPDRVVEVGVAAVDDDVARLEQAGQLVDHRVGAFTGLHHDDRGARHTERRDEVFDGFARHEVALAAVLTDELAGALRRAVEHGHHVAFAAGEVPGQVATHDGQADDAYVGTLLRLHAKENTLIRLPWAAPVLD